VLLFIEKSMTKDFMGGTRRLKAVAVTTMLGSTGYSYLYSSQNLTETPTSVNYPQVIEFHDLLRI
jgi:hypothetical protein